MAELDCERCGACCISNWDTETYVGMDEKDMGRLLPLVGAEEVDRLVGDRDNVWEMGLRTKENCQGHITCIALEGKVGERVSCDIYDGRPALCRAFKPGSEECRFAREEAGID